MPNDTKLRTITRTISADCIALRVRLLNRAVTAIYDEAFRGLGLTANQLNLLVAVSKIGKGTAKQLSTIMFMDPSTVSRNLERMRKEGWLRATILDDARSQELSVTDKGLRLLKRAYPFWQNAQAQARKVLGHGNASAISEVAQGVWSMARSR